MRTAGTRKHGSRESRYGREGVGGHNETGWYLTCVARVWLRCTSVSDRSSCPLHAVSICAYRCVAMGYRQTVGGSLCGVWVGGCGMAGTACHPAPEPRALGPLGSCACSVQTTHEHIVKHQHRRPVHFFASPHTARKNLRRAGRRRAPAPRNLVLKLQASNFEALDARPHAKEPPPETTCKSKVQKQSNAGGRLASSPRPRPGRRSMRSCPLARRARPPGGLHHRMRSEFLLRLRLPTLARRRAASGLRLLTPPHASKPAREPCGKISSMSCLRIPCRASRRSAGMFSQGLLSVSVMLCSCVWVSALRRSSSVSAPSRSSSALGTQPLCHQPLKVSRFPLWCGLTCSSLGW